MNPPPTPIIAERIPTKVPSMSGTNAEIRTPERWKSIWKGRLFNMRAYAESFFAFFSPVGEKYFYLAHGLKTLNEHIASCGPQHQHVSHGDQEIGVAELPQDLDKLNPGRPADDSANQEQQAHLDIHVSEAKMRQGARCRCPDNLV